MKNKALLSFFLIAAGATCAAAPRTERQIIREGYDGKRCFVHARLAMHGARGVMTAQYLNVAGCDSFSPLQLSLTSDAGKTWTPFAPQDAFAITVSNGIRSVCCDMTPMYHRATGRFLATGHLAQYQGDAIVPLRGDRRRRLPPYAVLDEKTGRFGAVRFLDMPDSVKFCDSGSGCSQCLELPDGDILMPISFYEHVEGKVQNAKAAVLRCAFDGERLAVKAIGDDIAVPDEVRGIGECSLAFHAGRYFLTIRGDKHGYVSASDDGLNYTAPTVWKWDTGLVVPTYNTQSHWMILGGRLYLVYTRKDGKNDHVFRNRAPLYAAEVDTDHLALRRATEWAVIPERGARLGNFGVCSPDGKTAYVMVAEWMQPKGCERYGSANAIWLATVRTER